MCFVPMFDLRFDENHIPQLVKVQAVESTVESIITPTDVFTLMNASFDMGNMTVECVYVLSLDAKHQIRAIFEVSKGGDAYSIFPIRDMVLRLILSGAHKVVVCHNHPTNNCSPSSDDILCTEKFAEVLKLVDIPLLDHIIVGHDTFYSFMENKLI